MRGSVQGSIFKFLLAFFAGAVAMLLIVVPPGKMKVPDLFDQEKRHQMADFDYAADNVEQAGELAQFYAYKAKQYIEHKFN